ncbi:Serine phosphatase RsbU, regulator of sigma subunit [Sporomusa ovata]|uniref:Serine phosphatase RsbU, regulator of sigma subunit n=1 Tax=Sporomusa ovata TaxID=2378 RepID=A0A0U1KTQ9_9FIRM|nr:Serine phosphatase RsbU, regulator of sigma subunit [Sporomusa ovata]
MVQSGIESSIQLLETTCVMVVLAYLLTRTSLSRLLVDRRTIKGSLILIAIFSIFSLYGAYKNIPINGGFISTRSLGSLAAGLLAGPWVGLGASVVGAVHRFSLGGFTVVSGTLYALLAGLAGGLFYRWKKGCRVTAAEAAAVTAAYEIFAAAMTLVLAPEFEKALQLVSRGFFAMTAIKCIGVSLFIFIINNFRDEQATRELKEKMDSELQVARDIQMSIVPKLFPPFPNSNEFDLYAFLEPAKAVGGDFYDFFFIDDEHLCVVVGDVSGKGVPASLFMAVALTLIRARGAEETSPSDLLSGVNNELCRGNDASMFATVFCGILHLPTGRMVYANGGHNIPYLYRQEEGLVETLTPVKGIALGVMEDMVYDCQETTLAAGDVLIMYTDGINEAMNTRYEQFGNDRLQQAILDAPVHSVQAVAAAILDSVRNHTAGAEQSDDITLMTVYYKGSQAAGGDKAR